MGVVSRRSFGDIVHDIHATVFSVLVALGLGASCGGDSTVVARAGEHALTAGRLAELIGPARPIRLDEESVYGVARRWVEYSVFGDSAAHHMDFLDSALMMAVNWPDARRAIVDSFRLTLLGEHLVVDSADVAALFEEDGVRRVSHVLIKSDPDDPAPPRRRAESVRAALRAGGSWATANESNQDELSKSHGGSIGVIRRNATVPPFETAAFALRPGEISNVVPTEFGFHVIYRPPLSEVWDEFADYLRQRSVQAFDSTYKTDLYERRGVAFNPGAIGRARAAVDDPNGAMQDRTHLATYDTGSFTVRTFARWMFHVLPGRFTREVRSAPEETVEAFIADIILQELMYEEALNAGITIPERQYETIAAKHDDQMFLLQVTTGLFPDSLAAVPGTAADQRAAAQDVIDQYLVTALRLLPRFMAVPPFLADTLLSGSDWKIYGNRLPIVIELAQPVRDSLLAAPPGPVLPDIPR